jgi:hypothetical protein
VTQVRSDETRWMAAVIELITLAAVIAFALARSAA